MCQKKTEKLYNFKYSLKLSFCLEVFEPKMSEKACILRNTPLGRSFDQSDD